MHATYRKALIGLHKDRFHREDLGSWHQLPLHNKNGLYGDLSFLNPKRPLQFRHDKIKIRSKIIVFQMNCVEAAQPTLPRRKLGGFQGMTSSWGKRKWTNWICLRHKTSKCCSAGAKCAQIGEQELCARFSVAECKFSVFKMTFLIRNGCNRRPLDAIRMFWTLFCVMAVPSLAFKPSLATLRGNPLIPHETESGQRFQPEVEVTKHQLGKWGWLL